MCWCVTLRACAVLLSHRSLVTLPRPGRLASGGSQPKFMRELWRHLRDVNVGFDADCEKVEQLAGVELSKSFNDSPDPFFYNTVYMRPPRPKPRGDILEQPKKHIRLSHMLNY